MDFLKKNLNPKTNAVFKKMELNYTFCNYIHKLSLCMTKFKYVTEF